MRESERVIDERVCVIFVPSLWEAEGWCAAQSLSRCNTSSSLQVRLVQTALMPHSRNSCQ